jgi:hypothetical protein
VIVAFQMVGVFHFDGSDPSEPSTWNSSATPLPAGALS